MAESVPMQRTDQLDVMVELLSELDADGVDAPQAFYDPLCEAVCRLTSMERVVLVLYDDARKLVVPAGSHGIEPGVLADVFGTLEETPLAQRALTEDRVVEASTALQKEVPPRYARLLGLTTLTCTPVSAGGRWLGVVFADRGGGRFTLTDQERHTMWTLGKTAALAASARIATRQQQRASLLSQRIDLAREVHERVMQRLFGVSLVLGAAHELTREERRRAGEEIQAAVGDLRSAMARPIEPPPHGTGAKLRDELDRLRRHYDGAPVEVSWERDPQVPEDLERLAQSVLVEALRNAHKHARASRVHVKVAGDDGLFVLEVRNDGVGRGEPGRGAGMGLRLAALDALQRGGVVEFGPAESSQWRVRLVVPVPEGE
ncbi:MAG: GAF domain-containing protein [Actinomycetota bacterium]|nr:GAF domain-containing protein [Actinomycetota bacterium]